MSNEIYILTVGFAAYVVFSLFYNYAARPMFCDRARFRIFALRDKLRRLAIDELISASSFEYQYLERLLCRLIEKCSWFSWGSFFEFLLRNKDAELSAETLKFESEASDAVKDIYYKAIMEMSQVLLTNSPIWTLFLGIIVAIGHFFGWAAKQWLEIKTKIFLEETIVDIPGAGLIPV
jgi:hypothetical protein